MNLSNLTNTSAYGTLVGSIKDSIPKILVNAPVSSYTKPLDSLRQVILERQDAADALAIGFSSVTELFDAAGEVVTTYKGGKPPSSFAFQISDDSLEMLASAIKQCGAKVDDNHYQLYLTSTTGIEYMVQLSYIAYADLWTLTWLTKNGGSADFVTYRPMTDGTVKPFMRFWATPADADIPVTESVLEIVQSLIQSNELNVAIAEVCGVMIRGKFDSYLKSIDLGTRTKPVRKFFNQLCSAYHHGGLKGAVYYIFSFIKGIDTLQSEDGTLEFTDNNKLRPSEYIAGFVQITLSVIATVATVIITVFAKVIGLILATIGSVLWGLFGNFKFDYDSTRASVVCEEDFDKAQVLDAAPFAGVQGQFLASLYPEYQDYYDRGDTVLSFDVPGGQLFIGPGAFDQDNNTVSYIKYEFHPLLPAFNWSGRALAVLLDNVKTRHVGSGQDQQYVDLKELWNSQDDENTWMFMWQDLTNWGHYPASSALINNDDGHLSNDNDLGIRRCMVLSLYFFIMHLLFHNDDFSILIQNLSEVYAFPQVSSDYNDLIFLCNAPVLLNTDGMVPTWNKILAGYTITNDIVTDWYDYDVYTNTPGDITSLYVYDVVSLPAVYAIIFQDSKFFGRPYTVPSQFRYGLALPKYNSETFFSWIATTIVTVSLITAITVFATVKTAQFIKRKRATNVARYFASQSKFQNAQRGIMEVEDPETGEITEVTYDMNSDDGKAYLNDCYKSYKKTAFRNNLWAKLIGGTRFDITTFYGEAEDQAQDRDITAAMNYADLYSYQEQDPFLTSADTQVTAVLDELNAQSSDVLDAIHGVRSLIISD